MPIPTISETFLCKINHTIMFEPVVAEDGFTYEKQAIEQWLAINNTSPTTREIIGNKLIPNRDVKAAVMEFLDRHSYLIYEAIESSTPEQDNLEFVNALIKRDAAILNRYSKEGQTPLHVAVINNKPNIVQMLLQSGANYKIRNKQLHLTPKKTAKILGFWDLVEIIEQKINAVEHMKLAELKQEILKLNEETARLKIIDETHNDCMELQQTKFWFTHSSNTSSSIAYSIASSSIAQPIMEQELTKFLKYIGFGKQDEADKMLQTNPQLTTLKGDLIDCSVYPETYKHRIFPNITALQYAVWALDFHMWKMIKQYMEKNNQQQQLHEQLEEINDIAHLDPQQGWLKKPNKNTNWPLISWTQLIKALKEYANNYDVNYKIHWSDYWRQQVGGAQLTLPAHVINEYSHPSRPFNPWIQWGNAETSLLRTGVSDWINEQHGRKLGKDFAWCGSDGITGAGAVTSGKEEITLRLVACACDWSLESIRAHASRDYGAVSKLLTIRAAQARVLLDSVLKPMAKPASPRP